LNISQRLVGLYILYEIYLHENVKTTPFYQLVLDLLAKPDSLHVAEHKLLTEFLKSVPKFAKQTPAEYIKEAEKSAPEKFQQDLDPYRKAHAENMPRTNPMHASSIPNILRDEHESTQNAGFTYSALDNDELALSELFPTALRPLPVTDEAYILNDVCKFLLIL